MLAAGTTLGPYKILAPLGAGGMGEVYRTRDTRLGRDVAIKVIHAEVARDPDRIKRFEQEARAAGALSHPNVCAIYDLGTHEGSPFVVMELLEGESLREKLRAGSIPVRKAIDYAAQAAHGLAAAHEKGVIHRDLKPENLFVTKDGRVKVLDFGLAKLTRPEVVASAGEPTVSIAATETGAVLGTVGYMSPEQVRGENADARSDLFALGAILYEMLTGKRAFHGAIYVETLNAILKEDPPPLSDTGRDVPPALGVIVRRCLEKGPEERFQNARDLAFALESIGSGQVQPQAAPTAVAGLRHRRRLVWAMAAVVLLGVSAWLAWEPVSRWLGGQQAAQPMKKDWILVAEFDGPPDDSTLAAAARSLVSAALDQSEILATVPRDQIQLALQQAGKPPSTRVSAEVARELVYRRAVRAVLEGEVMRIGRGYSVTLRVVDAESLKTVVTEQAAAKDEDTLIPVLGKLAERLRRDVGERRGAIAATRPMTAATTPSFEAYQLYVRAERLHEMNLPTALRAEVVLVRRALALDPEFASAWGLLGRAYYNLQQPDSALAAWQEALRHPERLTEVERLRLEASLAGADGDAEAKLEAYERVLQYSPGNTGALNGRAMTFEDLGRFEEALESVRQAEAASPFGPTSILRGNETYFLCDLGRTDEARKVAQQITGITGQYWLSFVELAAFRWAAAESCAAAAMHAPGISETRIPVFLASAQAGRGAFREAASSYERAERIGGQSWAFVFYQNKARRGRLLLCLLSGGAIPIPTDTWTGDSSTATLLTRGLRAAIAGDEQEAQSLLTRARARPKRDLLLQGATPILLEAWILGAHGRWGDVPRISRPIAEQPLERAYAYAAGMSAVRWTLADAYERCGQPDSAAVWLERVTTDPAGVGGDLHFCGAMQSVARQRLVLLYARMGRLAAAERHLAVLEHWWDRPDDVARRMLAEARAAVRSARGMARPERPRT